MAVEIDSTSVSIDSNRVTIEGEEVLVRAIKSRATRVEDYLGIGSPLIYR